jgi:predicted DNA-binding transcriptional regulator AlpA
MARHDALPANLPPRGLCREAAAQYVGVGVSKFDEMVKDGRMPQPRKIDSRNVWDKAAVDGAFDQLPVGDGGPPDESWGDVDAA